MMPEILRDRSSLAETAVVSLCTLAALALLGLVLSYWTWVWLAPRPQPRAQAAAEVDGRADSANGLFRTVQRDGTTTAAAGTTIRLLGVVAASRGRRGYAVVQIEPREILAVRQGEYITLGVRLAEVDPDHVILDRNGVRETLAWPNGISPAQSAAPRVVQQRD